MQRTTILFVALLVFISFAATATATDDGTAAVALVEKIHRAASANATNVLRTTIDAPSIARTVLGTYWQSATAGERKDFTEALTDAITAGFVRRFSAQSAGGFTVHSSRKLGNGDILVSTRMTRSDSRETALDWRIHNCHSGVCVADVLIDGASAAIQRRDEYKARMQANGGSIADLIASIRQISQ
jgi:ABC-type transporter MlaC component